MDKRKLKCPKCGGEHIEGFEDGYWFLCHDCGYNCPVYAEETEAIEAFLAGIVRRDIKPQLGGDRDARS